MVKPEGLEESDVAVDLGPLADTIAFALRRAQTAVAEDFHRSFGEEAIRPLQFAVLCLLKRHPGLRQSQVSEALGIKRTNFVPLLDELEKRGLAERRKVAGDRRAAALCLTEAGDEMVGRLEVIGADHEARLSARLGEGGRAQLLALLARLSEPPSDPTPLPP